MATHRVFPRSMDLCLYFIKVERYLFSLHFAVCPTESRHESTCSRNSEKSCIQNIILCIRNALYSEGRFQHCSQDTLDSIYVFTVSSLKSLYEHQKCLAEVVNTITNTYAVDYPCSPHYSIIRMSLITPHLAHQLSAD